MRKFKARVKRWFLGRPYRHMAKINRRFSLAPENENIVLWKKEPLLKLTPFSELLDRYESETAFIITSGPSVKEIDISRLSDFFSFGVNGSILKFIDANIAPTHYVICDEEFIFNRPEIVQKILSSSCHCFFTAEVISAICEISPDWLKNRNNVTLFHNHFKEYSKPALEFADIATMAKSDYQIITSNGKIGFSLNPATGMFTAHTVAYFALQIAYGLGFRTINIMGLDLGSVEGESRFYETGKSAMPSNLSRDYEKTILPSFEIVSELCKKNKMQVFNLSPVSRLPAEIIPRQRYEEALNIAKEANLKKDSRVLLTRKQ